ncbi:MAG: AbrB/MazE/SpoVT family DNA-binding domain-containing protein [Deltaproteobacteria bacterium]|nr:AbrB/MazE/SpoVT family DNA-binding domain-containing protein [Deltaproteobacteria bacterium]
MHKQIIKIGSSLGLTLPVSEVEKLNLKAGDEVDLECEGGVLKIRPVKKVRAVSLGGLWKRLKISDADLTEAKKNMWGKLID